MRNNLVIKGKVYSGDRYKFVGKNTNKTIIWQTSSNSFRGIYNNLVEMKVITRYDYDPVDEYLLDHLEKTYDDYYNTETEEYDFDQLYIDGDCFLTDEAYREIISGEAGNAYYQEFFMWDEATKGYYVI